MGPLQLADLCAFPLSLSPWDSLARLRAGRAETDTEGEGGAASASTRA